MIQSNLNSLDLNGKRVLLRADLNVPLKNGTIADDFRLRKIMPTMNLILNKGGNIILIAHLGRPKKPDPSLSLRQLLPWFEKQGYSVIFAPTIQKAAEKINTHRIVLLENLRFFSGEKGKDREFAQRLAALGDYFVNDAFASMHRDSSSITLVPKYFPQEKKTIGLLTQQELNMLRAILYNPAKPFALIIGGNKIATKIPFISALINKIDMLFLCPAIVFSFLKAQGEPVGKSLVNDNYLIQCKNILKAAQEHSVSVYFPIDYQIAMKSFEGPLSYIPGNEIPNEAVGINIGPQTVDLFASKFKNAKTILYNGLMGDIAREETIENTCQLFQKIAAADAHTIIAGGDSVAAAHICNVANSIHWCSSGGGATIAYLRNKSLPGLNALEKKA